MKSTPLRRAVALVCGALLGTAALTACGSQVTGSSAPGPAVSASQAAPVVLDEHADHTTVRLGVGATVRVELHSTYWSQATSSAPGLLEPTAAAPSPSTAPTCRPGAGCGTVSGAFVARAAGSVQLTAQRSSCGEAKPCAPDQQTFTVTVEISS
ncbi:hypothetical protein GCM10009665_48480 [Kitasatospora nipponensis]|uniref:Uncharacterized protein n=1 Tax=Kitasatospora nipponensis TaxID=258049 RepID=A0ABN1WKA3_9ACTN